MANAVALELYDPEQGRPIKGQTKKTIADKKSGELRIGDDNYEMPLRLDGDLEAMSEWVRITDLYKGAGLKITSSSDVNILARYCVLQSKYICILDAQKPLPKNRICRRENSKGVLQVVETEEYKEWKSMHKELLRINEALTKLEDKLFLNPLSKFKNIPMVVKKDERKEELKQLGFGDV